MSNARDDAFKIFFSCGSTNRIGGSGESNLDALGVGWEERLLHFFLPSFGSRFLLCFLMIIVAIGCICEMLNHGYTYKIDDYALRD